MSGVVVTFSITVDGIHIIHCLLSATGLRLLVFTDFEFLVGDRDKAVLRQEAKVTTIDVG